MITPDITCIFPFSEIHTEVIFLPMSLLALTNSAPTFFYVECFDQVAEQVAFSVLTQTFLFFILTVCYY